jgi:hypothetical protein
MCQGGGTGGGWGHGLRGAQMQGRVEGRVLTRIQASAREAGRLSRSEHEKTGRLSRSADEHEKAGRLSRSQHEKTSHHRETPSFNRFMDCVGRKSGAERQRDGTRLEREIGSQRAMYVAEIERNREAERRQAGRNKQQVAKTRDRHAKS